MGKSTEEKPLRRLPWDGPLHAGLHALPPAAAHYLRRVLRLQPCDSVEVFDGQGQVSQAILQADGHLLLGPVARCEEPGPRLTVAVSLPKGERADWLVEKLTELGVATIQWLWCERTVSLGRGVVRLERWQRLAQAAARQARRVWVPQVLAPVPLTTFVASAQAPCRLVAEPGATLYTATPARDMILVVGPEGGLTGAETAALTPAYTPVGLNQHVLRVETAAMAGAAIILAGG